MGLIELRGGEGPPVVCVHALSGAASPYLALARAWPKGRPVWGLTAPGLDDERAPMERLEALAATHLASLKDKGVSGGATLLGWSLGGPVALEMARQRPLERPIVLLDTRAFVKQTQTLQQLKVAFAEDLARAQGAALRAGSLEEPLEDSLAAALRQVGVRVEVRALSRRFEVMEAHLEAAQRGLGAPYEGAAILVRAARSGGPKALGLQAQVGALQVISVDAEHRAILELPAVERVVQELCQRLDRP